MTDIISHFARKTNSYDEDALFTEKNASYFLLVSFVVLLISTFIYVPYYDSYYYWDWGRHLSLSYFDGPPMIAYCMRLFAFLFGNTTYTINLLGIVCIYLTLFFIYKTAKMIFGKRVALNACLLWLLSPLVLRFLFIRVTYDNPFNLFWAATIYFSISYIQYKKFIHLYSIAGCIGLALLSKYTGIILIIALLIFITANPRYRLVWKNKHFYCAILLAALLWSPVIVWNYQHNWISFSYQLNAHKDNGLSFYTGLFNYLLKLSVQLNIILLLPLYGLRKRVDSHKKHDSIWFLHTVSVTFILFFIYPSFTNDIHDGWLLPLVITTSMLCAYYLACFQLRKLYIFIIMAYLFIGPSSIINQSIFASSLSDEFAEAKLASIVNQSYLLKDTTIVTSNWKSAAKLVFWLKDKPKIYTLPCGPENQYQYWRQSMMKNIKEKKIKQALYLDFADHSNCIKKHFLYCKPQPILSYEKHSPFQNKKTSIQLFLYQCVNG